jgi:hypothetical protein
VDGHVDVVFVVREAAEDLGEGEAVLGGCVVGLKAFCCEGLFGGS